MTGRRCHTLHIGSAEPLPLSRPYEAQERDLKDRFPEQDLHPEAAEALLGVMFLDDRDNFLNTSCHVIEVNRRNIDRRQPIRRALLHKMIDVSGSDQGFAGDTPIMQAITAQFRFFFYQ